VDCNSLICSMCVVDDHPHKTMSIFKYSEMVKNQLRNSLSPTNLIIDYCFKKECQFTQEIQLLESDIRNIEILIKTKKSEQEKLMEHRKNAESTKILVTKSIDEMKLLESIDKDQVSLVQSQISKMLEKSSYHNALFPIIEKERQIQEKEKQDHEKLEKQKQEQTQILKQITPVRNRIQCYKCGTKPSTMVYFQNNLEVHRNDNFRMNGISAVCASSVCENYGMNCVGQNKWVRLGTF